jgi:prepilin-type N-terminal cleavage/methylation domain-containing protein
MSRRGHTLTELLVVMSMASVIFTVGVGLVHRVMHEQKFADRDNAMHRVAERLSTKLREDVHVAERAELIQSGDEGEQQLVLNQSGERIVTYAVRHNVMEREATGAIELTHRDSYEFPENYRLEFFDDPAKLVVFTAFAIPQAYLATGIDKARRVENERDVRRAIMHIEASVGRDHRFLSDTKEAE